MRQGLALNIHFELIINDKTVSIVTYVFSSCSVDSNIFLNWFSVPLCPVEVVWQVLS